MQDEVKAAREGFGIVADLVKSAGDDPQVREAAKNLGQAAVTITKTINTALLPLAAINFAFDKAREYFSERFQQDLLDRTRDIPFESITDPKPSVVGPALQGLAFAHEDPALKSMFLNLIATAMDRRVSQAAHPAFVEVIKQLDGSEAKLLAILLRTDRTLEIVQLRAQYRNTFKVRFNHLLDLVSQDRSPLVTPRIGAMMDNWIRLGLIQVEYGLSDERPAFRWLERRPEYQETKSIIESEGCKITSVRGWADRTDFGRLFAEAVGLLKASSSSEDR